MTLPVRPLRAHSSSCAGRRAGQRSECSSRRAPTYPLPAGVLTDGAGPTLRRPGHGGPGGPPGGCFCRQSPGLGLCPVLRRTYVPSGQCTVAAAAHSRTSALGLGVPPCGWGLAFHRQSLLRPARGPAHLRSASAPRRRRVIPVRGPPLRTRASRARAALAARALRTHRARTSSPYRQPDRSGLGSPRHVAESPGGARGPLGCCAAAGAVTWRSSGSASGPGPLGSR